ncbi:MAG: DNA polymerase Y family protein [Desulfobacterales bacterium]|nr:MAG: DNA polymerase Y family protein [Desulfobacterales bacterium]
MDRMACVNLPVFPVQLLLRRHPDWGKQPVAVVAADTPQGMILAVNEAARSLRILPGMRYAAGLSLAGSLRAAAVPPQEIAKMVASLGRRLRSFSPRIEPAVDEPGVFWLDASGLERLYGSLSRWAGHIRSDLRQAGFSVTVVVGFSRFGTYALAKAKRGIIVLRSVEEEQVAAQQVPLDRLVREPETRQLLEKLGIQTVGQFIDLPSEGIAQRLGPTALQLHQLAAGRLRWPLQAERPPSPAMQQLVLDYPEINLGRLMAAIEQLLHPLLQMLAQRGRVLTEVQVRLRFDRGGDHMERIRPAAPTREARQLLDLIRLRLYAILKLPDGVVEISLVGRSIAAKLEQPRLLGSRPKRDLAAANRALARVRAEFGDEAVVFARLREGHLPEGRFIWEPLDTLAAPRPCNVETRRLIRRIQAHPIPLPRPAADGWIPPGLPRESAGRAFGPYIVSGGWWRRWVHREYYFAESQTGAMLWVYYDRIRQRWFLQGRVE